MNNLYSLANAQKFNWSSITGDLNPERISHLETYLVGNNILDAGCGGGAYVEFLSQKGLEVTGVDKYKQFLQVAQERGRIGTYEECDITNLKFSDKIFDCTYCFDVLEHVDDKLAIQELARVTTSRLIIAVPKEDEIMHEFNLTFLHYQDKSHIRNYSEQTLKELITTINYSKLSIFPELQVPARFLVKKMILSQNLYPKKNFVSKKLITLILPRLLNKASYQSIFTGLVAIVDL